MKALLYLDAVLTALGTVMTVVLAVICLLFGIYHDAAPAIGRSLPKLVLVTAGFTLLMIASGTAMIGLLRRRRWVWFAQAALAAVIPLAAGMVWAGVSSG